ncbi:carboxymuconolactone decarboxylase family protein [Candidatus Colwellia aromaticivorans]|uniref:carboxymuconolactone decarboxylase family protein n=1 Tax=Candidatus Colwellia aromaticivorans TaxID=2267621 RepID=UPI000DF3E0F9|nr:carboxymuconolactone decarboxylase family protein [Candidatus Colwellia aromaticivorans]
MSDFIYHTTETSANEAAKVLSDIKEGIGFVPNIFAIIAESTPALRGLVTLNDEYSHSSFSAEEQQIILITTSTVNECIYCVAGHTAFAEKIKMPSEIITSMRNQESTANHNYNVLATTVRQLIEHKGRVSQEIINNFINAGFSKAQFLELVMGICVKTFTNYVSNALNVELDEAFKPYAWQRPSDVKQQVA